MKKTSTIIAFALLYFIFPIHCKAASTDVSVRITKHCEAQETSCPEPSLENDIYMLNEIFNQNDTISLDIKIKNPSQQKITSTQTWLNYNTKYLEGISIDTYTNFDLVAPGEKTFDTENGRAKIGVASTSGGASDADILVATVKFKVITPEKIKTKIEFYDHRLSELGHTNVNIIEAGFPVNILTEIPKSLDINLNGKAEEKPTGGPAPDIIENDTFPLTAITLGRPTGLQIDTGDSYVHLKWDESENSMLASYNIYYGMTRGRYLHKKQVGLVHEFYITGLINEQTYFFAVTSIDANNNESDYSDEVAITVNHPETSTSPFIAAELETVLEPVAQKKTSDTGPETQIVIILALLSGITSILITQAFKNKKNLLLFKNS